MSISPKLSDSDPVDGSLTWQGDDKEIPPVGRWLQTHRRRRLNEKVIRRLITDYTYQIKFVVGSPDIMSEIQQWLALFPSIDPSRVLLMPEARTAAQHAEVETWLEPLAAEYGYKFCPREHVKKHDGERGK